jgi:hypothetical protein
MKKVKKHLGLICKRQFVFETTSGLRASIVSHWLRIGLLSARRSTLELVRSDVVWV